MISTEQPLAPIPPGTTPVTTGRGSGRRFLHALAAPIRFAYRRPFRALTVLSLTILVVAAIGAASVWVWFEYHLRIARTELAKGHNAAATAQLRLCQSVRPESRDVMILMARAARRTGALEEAELILDRCWELHGDEDAVVAERLFLRAVRGDIEAVKSPLLSRIREETPDASLAREALITGLIYRFHWAAARDLLNDWLVHDPNSTAALLLRGKLEEQVQLFPNAAESYRRVLELDPEQDEARLRLTTLLLANRKGDEALDHLVELRKRLADHPEVQIQWAKALALQGRTAESRAALAACLRDHPDYPAALAEHGSQALLDGDEATAERELGRAVAGDPGNLAVRSQYALALARNGKREDAAHEEARMAALKADGDRITALTSGPLQANPNDPAILFEIGQIALRSGQVREAMRWLNSALQADPNHIPTHRALVVLYRELDNPILSAKHRALAQKAGRLQAKP